jgi:dTDP-4-amino-4,6-dideoxygalactose transaminase
MDNIKWVPNKPIREDTVRRLMADSVRTNQFTNNGPNVQLLESTIRRLLKISDTKAVICVSNATHGIWSVVSAFELYHNKDVQCATQSLTFPSSAQGYLKSAYIIDVDTDGGIDVTQIPNNVDCVIITNIFGTVVDIQKYIDWCKLHNKLLVFDNAATPYSFYKGQNACNYGNAAIVSFHHTKPIGFGEGGCVIIDKQYEESIRKIINFGFDEKHLWNKLGSNYKMSDISAVYILQHLEGFSEMINKHANLRDYFIANLPDKIKMYPNFADDSFHSCFCILTENSDFYHQRLLENNVMARKYYEPLTPTPIANDLFYNILCIPCNVDMGYSDIDMIISILKNELL